MQLEPISILTGLLQQSPGAKELEITYLPLPDDIYESVSFLKDGIHLGIHAPHVPQLAREFRKSYYGLRKKLMMHANSKSGDEKSFGLLMGSISCLLLLCPDHASAWSDRKRLLLHRLDELKASSCVRDTNNSADYSTIWEGEMSYLDLLFTQHSKAPNAWSHRRWICKQMLRATHNVNQMNHLEMSSTQLMTWFTHEIDVCINIAERKPKNYYAWTHRRFIIGTLVDRLEKTEDRDHELKVMSLLKSEVGCIHPWLCRHISDHSAAHYGGEVYRLWLSVGNQALDSVGDAMKSKEEEIHQNLKLSWELIELYPSHEVIWIWRRISASFFLEYKKSKENIRSDFSRDSKKKFVENEIAMVANIRNEESSSDDEIGSLKSQHAISYLSWILRKIDTKIVDVDISNVRSSLIFDDNDVLQCLWSNISRAPGKCVEPDKWV
uniref:Uncharacterized protein n=1 Tax=Chaetoceros debilis TaxID=122233 RepID=A0A7S3V647_9STRA|mmetsp:Transcript_20662/g.31373  ORF Transcript_20662/g.31373 Transcript_20662/m.31373 type:complete len:438 (+) Transcript_20662:238-1551(+)